MGKKLSARGDGLYIGKETTFKTGVVPTAKLRHTGFSGGIKPKYITSASKTGSRAQTNSKKVSSLGNLSVPFELDEEIIGFALKGMLGSESVSDLGSGNYKHTFTMLNDSTLPSFSFTGEKGMYKLFRYVSAVMKSLSLELATEAYITGTAEYAFFSEEDLNKTATFDATANTVECVAHGLVDNNTIRFVQGSSLPAELEVGTVYYVVNKTTDDFQVSLTNGGAAVDFTTAGGTAYFYNIPVLSTTSDEPYTFKEGIVKIDTVAVADAKNISLSLSNTLDEADFRLTGDGQVASFPAGAFEATGSLQLVFNDGSYAYRSKYLNDEYIALSVEMVQDANNKIIVNFPKAKFTDGSLGNEDDGISLELSFTAFGNPISPLTVELYNSRATAY